MVSDEQLVTRAIAGEEAAFEALYDRYARLVRTICFDATGDALQAQDLVQEVFLRAFTRLETIYDAGKFGAWLVGIARMVIKEWIRKKGRDRHRFDATLADTLEAFAMEVDDRISLMHDAMQDLEDDERFALHAVYLQGKSARIAREVLDLSQSGFYKLLDRARVKLEKAISTRNRD